MSSSILDEKERQKRVDAILQRASIDELKASLNFAVNNKPNTKALYVSAELSKRGIAPHFQDVNSHFGYYKQMEKGVLPIALLIDLKWFVIHYPHHLIPLKRARAIFNPDKFIETANYLHWNGKRRPEQIAKALGLTDQQQKECLLLKSVNLKRWEDRLNQRLSIARTKIAEVVRNTDKRNITEQDITIERRSNLWVCAELAEWKPQRTANFYTMMTGEVLQRNLVAKQLEKLPKVQRVKRGSLN